MVNGKNSPLVSDAFNLIVTNALDFLERAVSELNDSPKYSVINFYSAVELLVKAKLLLEHWSLIVEKPHEATITRFNEGDFASVGLHESLKRLKNIADETLTNEAIKSFDALRKHRNKLVHFSNPEYFSPHDEHTLTGILVEQCRVWFYLHEILTDYWSENFSEYLSDIDDFDRSMRKNTEYLKTKYDLIEQKINTDLIKGAEYIECSFCHFVAVKADSTPQTCLVCRSLNTLKNTELAYIGVVLGGPFNIPPQLAMGMLNQSNRDSRLNNADVVRQWRAGRDISLNTESFVIDFGDMSRDDAEKYEAPFQYIIDNVYPVRKNARNKREKEYWWHFSRPRKELRQELAQLEKYIATPAISKHRFFVWLGSSIIPAQQVTVVVTSDSYVFGVLHSKCHTVWTELVASKLHDVPRYTPSVFRTFPFPYPIQTQADQEAEPFRLEIGRLADRLDSFRISCFQNHDEKVTTEMDQSGLTMTQVYNDLYAYRAIPLHVKAEEVWEITYKGRLSLGEVIALDSIQNQLDDAVLKAYGWQPDITYEEIAEHLTSLSNLTQ